MLKCGDEGISGWSLFGGGIVGGQQWGSCSNWFKTLLLVCPGLVGCPIWLISCADCFDVNGDEGSLLDWGVIRLYSS